jgi:hypothetical protein
MYYGPGEEGNPVKSIKRWNAEEEFNEKEVGHRS